MPFIFNLHIRSSLRFNKSNSFNFNFKNHIRPPKASPFLSQICTYTLLSNFISVSMVKRFMNTGGKIVKGISGLYSLSILDRNILKNTSNINHILYKKTLALNTLKYAHSLYSGAEIMTQFDVVSRISNLSKSFFIDQRTPYDNHFYNLKYYDLIWKVNIIQKYL